ncbi:hypothetical protein TRFO_18057 [Tritrichomonas foetus]|uniref:Ankyrin repeat protein n=1 Tax=Tritrichomonas foetus TaxID=1144522 RepID=A0A1J4KM85_9EUKA|nr:hypothetical protein TRFO_18057 [Tritrichomonas foetus]|eukprot:OHT12250.1 hypothetical protein TRFO_18057 [Tritrichomonas foetus]
MEAVLQQVINLDDTQKFKALMYGKDGTYKLGDQYLTQLCALCDSPGCMALSILMGQPVNLDGDVMAPLNCASYSGSVETAALLIEAGARINSVYNDETPLMTAIRNSTFQHVNILLQAKADLVPIEYAARYARTPDVLIPFMDIGDKDVALNEATATGRIDNVQCLLDHGAKPSLMTLLVACSYNFYFIVKMLLDAGVQADDTAMQTCIFWNSLESMQELTKWGLPCIDFDVHFAIMHNKPKGLTYCLDHGVSVECEINGTLPMHVAARHGRTECLKVLIERGAHVNCADNLGCTPLHWAAIWKNPDALKLLLEHAAYVNISEGDVYEPLIRAPTPDWSPIHVSVEGRGFEVVQILLENKATQLKMWDGRTPLHIAVMNERNDLFPVLLNFGADLKETNIQYQTPIELALSMGRDDLANELRALATADAAAAQDAKSNFEQAAPK